MPSLGETGVTAKSQFAAAADAGVETLALDQVIRFDLYNRVVLSQDGMVFWVKATPTVAGVTQVDAMGSLHFSTVNSQDEDANISVNTVVFTSETEVNDLNGIGETQMWIATYSGSANRNTPMKIGFFQIGQFYEQAQLWHYRGNALYPDQQTQIIDNPAQIPSTLIVSNSLPIWLYLSQYQPSFPTYGFGNPFALYPSFLVPSNLNPAITPYGAVHIPPESTEVLQSAPIIDSNSSHFQLTKDQVRITLYGGTNKQALDFVDCINQYSVDYDTIGIMNMPVIRDQKRTQSEFTILGMKKLIVFDVSYYQSNVVAVARKLITKATETFILKST